MICEFALLYDDVADSYTPFNGHKAYATGFTPVDEAGMSRRKPLLDAGRPKGAPVSQRIYAVAPVLRIVE